MIGNYNHDRQDDDALDWLFGQARRYPLLDSEEERDVDRQKWQAIVAIQSAILADPGCRAYLARFTTELADRPPALDSLASGEGYHLLRREVAEYLPGKTLREQLEAARTRLEADADTAPDEAAIDALALPAALVAGMASVLLGESDPRGVARGLQRWQATWPNTGDKSLPRAKRAALKELQSQLKAYQRARNRLVNHNLRLVFSVAFKQRARRVPFRDLVQEGVFGLIRAAEKFQYRRGYRFSTYAYNWVSQAVRRALAEQDGIVRFPTQVTEQVGRLYRERMEHLQYKGSEPASAWLAERLKLKRDDVEKLRQLGNLGISLSTPRTEDEDGPDLEATLVDPTGDDTAAGAEEASLRRTLEQGIRRLGDAERQVIALRYGLGGRQPLTRAELAVQLGVSVERIRQIEGSALRHMRDDPELLRTFRDYTGGTA